MRNINMRLAALVAGAMVVVIAGVLGGLAPAGATPPGSSGTIKIDGVEYDSHPNNEPHVGCTFEVDFYGFDAGDIYAAVTFEASSPTKLSGSDQVLLSDSVFIGEDDSSGGGSESGLDASRQYTLDVSGMTAHPNQGYHVQLTVNADGSKGSGKHKTFWISDCDTGPIDPPPGDD